MLKVKIIFEKNYATKNNKKVKTVVYFASLFKQYRLEMQKIKPPNDNKSFIEKLIFQKISKKEGGHRKSSGCIFTCDEHLNK
jgi:hypothetical protein